MRKRLFVKLKLLLALLKLSLPYLITATGFVLFAKGLWMIFPPAAYVATGAALTALGLFWDTDSDK